MSGTDAVVPSSEFRLTKWYMDCISRQGEACIAYTALVQWKSFSFQYNSVISRSPGGKYSSAMSIKKCPLPFRRDELLRWECEPLHLYGEWQQNSPGFERTLYETPEGFIRWSCFMPGAFAVLRRRDSLLSGHGYVECLEMTLLPWRLPFKELRWGRFVDDNDSLVWIDWRNGLPLNLLLHNGEEAPSGLISDAMVSSNDGSLRLQLDNGTVLRSGSLMQTVFSDIPFIRAMFPGAFFDTDESKWLSASTLTKQDGTSSRGFSIHEKVRFR